MVGGLDVRYKDNIPQTEMDSRVKTTAITSKFACTSKTEKS